MVTNKLYTTAARQQRFFFYLHSFDLSHMIRITHTPLLETLIPKMVKWHEPSSISYYTFCVTVWEYRLQTKDKTVQCTTVKNYLLLSKSGTIPVPEDEFILHPSVQLCDAWPVPFTLFIPSKHFNWIITAWRQWVTWFLRVTIFCSELCLGKCFYTMKTFFTEIHCLFSIVTDW